MDIAIFALYLEGGANRKVHLEEIAQKCHEMAPGRFSWELPQFKRFPDIKVVFYSLDEARKARRGELVESFGSRSRGGEKFQITLSGVKWMKDNEGRISRMLKLKSSTIPFQQVRSVIRAVKNDKVFKKFREEGVDKLSVYDLADFLGCSMETSPTEVRKKFGEMKVKTELVEDSEISAFLRSCEERFDLLRG